MYTCILIDDQARSIDALKEYIAKVPTLKLVGTFTDPILALSTITADQKIDLILMDIDMPLMSGIELAQILRPKTRKLVFTTAHVKYGYEAFKVNADDFLLKPYSFGEFVKVIDKLFNSGADTASSKVERNFFFVKSKEDENRIVKIDFNDVIAIESNLNYVSIHTISRRISTLMTLTEISKIFISRAGFVKFQRSFILNQQHISSIDGMTIRMKGQVQLTVGDYYRKEFKRFLEENLVTKSRIKID